VRGRIRKARGSDGAAVKAIEVSSSLAPWKEEDYTAEASRKGSIFLVAEDLESDTIVGFLIVRLITKTNPHLTNTKSEITSDLLNLAITPTRQRTGVATFLLQAAMDQIPGPSQWTVFLEVRASNSPAISFYKQFGFKRIGVRPKFYTNPNEDALLMEAKGDKLLATNPPDEVVFEL
jgi:ribosomal-protein-alanine N-acetyltransferase